MSARILIVDDHEAVRRGIRSLLSSRPQWKICGEAKDGLEAVEMTKALRPHVVLMDISMPRMDGAQATRIIRREVPESEVIVISQNDPTIVTQQAAEIDAHGYVAKTDLSRDLLPTIDRVVGREEGESREETYAANKSLQHHGETDFQHDETAAIALHGIGPDGIILWANQVELDMLGYTREEYVGHHISEFHVDATVIEDILGRLSRRDVLLEHEARLRHKDGTIRYVLINSSAFFENGEFIHTRCFMVDVTERKKVQAQLQDSERRFREMIDALPAAVYTTDAEGRLTHFNPAAVEFSGRVPQLGTDHWCVTWKLFRPDGSPLPHEECPMAIALKEGRIEDGMEVIAERPDGKRVWFTPYPRPLHDAEGRIVGGINMLVDITERKQAERASHLLVAIVDSSDDAIVSKNLDGVITSWNKGAERLFGYAAEEAIGQHITLIVPHDRWEEEATILKRLRRGERVEHFETVRVSKDGNALDLSLTISPIKDNTGRVVGASKVARDITKQKQTERALRESEEQLRKLADELEMKVRVRTQQLERRNAEVLQQSEQLRELSNRLLRSQDDERRRIARELHDSAGQLLTALGMNLASMTQQAEQNPERCKIVQECVDLVQELSKEIRTMSYLLHPPLLDESGLREAIHWYMRGLMERSGLHIELNISEDFGRLPAPMELAVFRIVQECLTNIHRHSDSKTAAIRLSRTKERVSLEVQDEGQGIPPEKLAAIQGQRSGVGITGMRERVRHLGGEIDIQSNGKGARISVILPIPIVAASETENEVQQAVGN